LGILLQYFIQHCFICRLSVSIVSWDSGIEPRTVATSSLALADALTSRLSGYLVGSPKVDGSPPACFLVHCRKIPVLMKTQQKAYAHRTGTFFFCRSSTRSTTQQFFSVDPSLIILERVFTGGAGLADYKVRLKLPPCTVYTQHCWPGFESQWGNMFYFFALENLLVSMYTIVI
jgi:hypothetical protein